MKRRDLIEGAVSSLLAAVPGIHAFESQIPGAEIFTDAHEGEGLELPCFLDLPEDVYVEPPTRWHV